MKVFKLVLCEALMAIVVVFLICGLGGCGVAKVGDPEDLADYHPMTPDDVVAIPEETAGSDDGTDSDDVAEEESEDEEDAEDWEEDTEEDGDVWEEVELQTYTQEWENYDGYKLEGTYTLSPWIKYSDSSTLRAVWEQMGFKAEFFPDLSDSRPQYNYVIGPDDRYDMICVLGYFDIKNKTPDFDISAENPVIVDMYLGMESEDPLGPMLALVGNDGIWDKCKGLPKDEVGRKVMFEDLGFTRPSLKLRSNYTRAYFMVVAGVGHPTPNEPDKTPDPAGIVFNIYDYNDLQSFISISPKASWE